MTGNGHSRVFGVADSESDFQIWKFNVADPKWRIEDAKSDFVEIGSSGIFQILNLRLKFEYLK